MIQPKPIKKEIIRRGKYQVRQVVDLGDGIDIEVPVSWEDKDGNSFTSIEAIAAFMSCDTRKKGFYWR